MSRQSRKNHHYSSAGDLIREELLADSTVDLLALPLLVHLHAFESFEELRLGEIKLLLND
jgi:hypothetical protein